MKIASIYLLLSLLSLILKSCQRSVNFTKFAVSPYVVDNKWEDIAGILKGQPVTELVFQDVLLCNEGLKRILAFDSVAKSLKSLSFSHIPFNQQMIKTVWQSLGALPIVNLSLNGASLQNSDFKLIPMDTQSKIERLSLQNNFIRAEGFKYLSQTKLKNIKSMNFYGLSMVQNESVDSILQMNIGNWQELNIGYTSLSDQNALKLLKALNKEKLTSLNICKNFSIKAKNNFQASFYQNFSEFNFKALKTLDISDLLLDQNGVKYLKDMKFPELTKLSVGKNQFFVDGLYTFLNKKNFPKLNELIIDEVIFHNSFFPYLVKEFQGTLFKTLVLNGDGIEPQILKHLQKLNFSSLKTFQIIRGFMKAEIFSHFLEKSSFNELQELNLRFIANSGNILERIMEKTWPKLKILKLGRIGRVDFKKLQLLSETKRFPQIENIEMDARNLSPTQIQRLIFYLSKTWTKLVNLQLCVLSQQLIRKISEGLLSKVEKQIYLNLKNIQTDALKVTISSVFLAMLNPKQKPTVYFFNYRSKIQEQYGQMHASSQQEQILDQNQESGQDKYVKQRSKEYFKSFNFNEMKSIEEGEDCLILGFLMEEQMKKDKKCQFPHVASIDLGQITNKCYEIFNKCAFPNAQTLEIKFEEEFDSNHSDFQLMGQNFSQLRLISLVNQNTVPNTKIIQMFKVQKFQTPSIIYFDNTDMKSEDIEAILLSGPNMKRVRNILIFSARIRELNFFSKLNMTLRVLIFGAEIIGDNIYQLANLNFQFMTTFIMMGNGITNQYLLALLQKLPKRDGPAFPKISKISLRYNYIETSGTLKLFQSGFPMLQNVEMVMNKDPEIINTILGSSKSHRIDELAIYRNDENSIDPNLNPKNTRQLRTLVIDSANLQVTDFKALSKMDFHSLKRVYFQFSRIFECQTLEHIKKIASTVQRLNIEFSSKVQMVNSDCLSGEAKSDQNLKHISWLLLVIKNPMNSNLRKFFDLLIFDQVLESLVINGVYPSEKAFRRLTYQANLDYLIYLDVRSNDLTDQMVQQLLNRDFKQLEELFISENERLTSNAIKFMENRTYPILRNLGLCHTSLNDSAIKTLLTCKFPSLQSLTIANVDITGNALSDLSNLDAPFLNRVDFSNNNFKFSDAKKFNPKKFPYLKQIRLLPYIVAEQYQKLSQIYNVGRKKGNKIQIKADILNTEGYEEDQEIEGNTDK